MLRLNTLGGVALVRDEQVVLGAATSPKRLALLMLLATAGSRGVARELLSELLWPESSREDARHSLQQVVHTTRRALEANDLFLGTTTLCLNPSRIECDLWTFANAIKSRRYTEAVAVYRGQFAHDFVLRGAPDIEHRFDALRQEIERDCCAALEVLAKEAVERGDVMAAQQWWSRLATVDRASGRVACGLIDAYVAAGDRPRALQFAMVHREYMRTELETAPDPEVLKRIQMLRSSMEGESAGNTVKAAPHRMSPGEGMPSAVDARMDRLARVLGKRYQLQRLLDDGRFTASFSARGAASDVVIQLVQQEVAALVVREHFIACLERAATLSSRHVVPILEVGGDGDVLYLVTPHRTRPSLKDLTRSGRAFSMTEAIRVAEGIASALRDAHERAVCHGALRPKHVEVDRDAVAVGGFGFIEAVTGGQKSSTEDRTTVVAIGSPAFMSPEQLTGQVAADATSDVYAFGCIFFQLLAGQPPFNDGSNVSRKLTQGPPRVREFRENTPESVVRIVERCLMRVPADRYESGVELWHALNDIEAPSL